MKGGSTFRYRSNDKSRQTDRLTPMPLYVTIILVDIVLESLLSVILCQILELALGDLFDILWIIRKGYRHKLMYSSRVLAKQ